MVVSNLNNKQGAWQINFGGFIQTDYLFDTQKMNSEDGFDAPSIVIPQNNSKSSYFSVRQSQLRVNIKNKRSDISGKIEIDFYGANGTTAPRLRQAYFTWKNFIFGQLWSNFSDTEISGDLFDFIGPNGMMSVRQIQLRYTSKIGAKQLLSFSLEDPKAPSISFSKDSLLLSEKALFPSFTASYRYGNNKEYIRLAGILTPVSYVNNINVNGKKETVKTLICGGVNLSGVYYIGSEDNIKVQTSYGIGFSTNNVVLHHMGYDIVEDTEGILKRLPLFNILFLYEHWWNKFLSSTFYFSDSKFSETSFMTGEKLANFQNAGTNLIYHPLPKLQMGFECTYGRVENVAKIIAKAMRYQFSTSFTF